MKYLYIVFFAIASLAQNKPIEIEIVSVTDFDSLPFRKFIITYSIRNTTNERISFFLNPERVLAGSGGSMSTNVSANLFQEKEELPLHTILSFTPKSRELPVGFENLKEGKEKDEVLKKYLKEVLDFDIEEEIKKSKDDANYFLKKTSESMMKSIMTLEPLETKQYSKTFYWDKKRYHKIDEMEYYINEKTNCFLQLFIVLLKEEFKERLLEADYNKVINTPNFIKGWFTSNKVTINFYE